KLKEQGIDGIAAIKEDGDKYVVSTIYGDKAAKKAEALAERCVSCKSRKHMVYDELIGEEGDVIADCGRFDMVEKLEAMTPDERYEFWRGELSRCIRCNACRNVCPACTCEQCIFDNPKSGVSQKAAANSFEENMFHIIRAFHVAGRCTDCGECSRVCPENIPLHLLNRKFIKDVNTFYGTYQAGEDPAAKPPLGRYEKNDIEPGEAGGVKA
ncbi:MAG: 4Fe-4S dicluster domain-containing protein, partial [Clostridia bacterium]|nr:4Fe-4S dicluster domain-containing protein [Clostridia bacterium]